ncbi:hypothetical protein FJY93_04865 [Candidatus Kaiserbacteria bacterium]|nr:hypothetical protein [Candidatus Kaiserbacteria bacterium]
MELFHICNRGVEKRDVFLDDGDRARFVHNLFVLNDANPAPNHILHRRGNTYPESHERSPLVAIHSWCLMPNHYHILVSPVDDDPKNLSLFAQKLGMGYSKFFNDKYERSGSLWQGKYRKVHIENDAHFLYVPFYIHLNPLDLSMPEWREGKVGDVKKALEMLHEYRWSSFFDYTGTKNFPSIIDRDLLGEILGSRQRQEKVITEIIGGNHFDIVHNLSESLEM